jgi:transcriptional regulator with XRE-family HTH domain
LSFGGHLRALREQAGLSRAEVARRAGVPASTLRDWESDRGFPTTRSGTGFFRLAGALGVPFERLAEGVEDPAVNEADEAPEERPGARKRKGKAP